MDKPAFPTELHNRFVEGMTLREWYARMALQGMISNPKFYENTGYNLIEGAFNIADSMIKESELRKKDE